MPVTTGKKLVVTPKGTTTTISYIIPDIGTFSTIVEDGRNWFVFQGRRPGESGTRQIYVCKDDCFDWSLEDSV